MGKALIVATVVRFICAFERNDIKILQSMGYEVHCACRISNISYPEKFAELKNEGVIFHDISFTRNPFSWSNIGAFFQLLALMKNEKFDLVHCHTPVGGVLGRCAARIAHTNHVIYTAHGFHFCKGAPIKNWFIYFPIEWILSFFTESLITLNTVDYDLAVRRFHAKRIYRIYGVGIDISEYEDKNGNLRIRKRKELGLSENDHLYISVGELDKDKNHELMIKAISKMDFYGKYYICGEGTRKSYLNNLIEDNKLKEKVTLLGYRRDIAELLSAADFFVFPSRFEGISVALMEAIAAKKIIICSNCRGNTDLVLNERCMFDCDSVDELIAAINYTKEKDMQKSINENYQNLQLYKLSEVQKEMIRIYEEVGSKI